MCYNVPLHSLTLEQLHHCFVEEFICNKRPDDITSSRTQLTSVVTDCIFVQMSFMSLLLHKTHLTR